MVEHTIDGIRYRIHHDGALDLEETNGQRVQLAPGVLFGLSVILRWPGVRPILAEAEKERQRQNDYSDDDVT